MPEQDDAGLVELLAAYPNLVDLGHGTYALWSSWGTYGRVGLTEFHRCAPGCRAAEFAGWCGGGVLFDLPGVREAFPGRSYWRVEQDEPLTITPSVACGHQGCTHHGWIRGGVWAPA